VGRHIFTLICKTTVIQNEVGRTEGPLENLKLEGGVSWEMRRRRTQPLGPCGGG